MKRTSRLARGTYREYTANILLRCLEQRFSNQDRWFVGNQVVNKFNICIKAGHIPAEWRIVVLVSILRGSRPSIHREVSQCVEKH